MMQAVEPVGKRGRVLFRLGLVFLDGLVERLGDGEGQDNGVDGLNVLNNLSHRVNGHTPQILMAPIALSPDKSV